MQSRFAGHPARIGVGAGRLSTRLNSRLIEAGQILHRGGRLIRFSAFQLTICILLGMLGVAIGVSLISVKNITVELNANVHDNTRALAEMQANFVSSVTGIDRKLADTNQKLFDLVVEVDDLIAAARRLSPDEADLPADRKKKADAKPAASTREGTRTSALTIHRRRLVR